MEDSIESPGEHQLDATPDTGVGYCRPPRKHQYKPGQCGNPKGRPKAVPTPGAILKKQLNQTVTVREGAKTRRMTKLELFISKTLNGAIKGEAGAMKSLMMLLKLYPTDRATVTSDADENLTATDEAILRDFAAQAGLSPAQFAGMFSGASSGASDQAMDDSR